MPGIRLDPSTGTITFSQSWLKDFLVCPERARRGMEEPRPSNNDATARGHALHEYMAWRLRGSRRSEAMAAGIQRLHTLSEMPDFQWVQVKRMVTLERHVTNLMVAFERHVLPQVPEGGAIERTLTAPVGVIRGWDCYLTGTPDYLHPMAIWDWKSSGQVWDRYQTANWDIQSSAYTFLAYEALGLDIAGFTFVVGIVPHGDLQIIDVTRGEGDWLWLKRQIAQAVHLLDVMPGEEWITNHQHWLCSARWCPYWDTCRGPYQPSLGEAEGADEEETA